MIGSKKDFIIEAEEIIENIRNSLLDLQAAFSPDTLNSVFRGVNTLRGLSRLFGFRGITDLSQALESLIDDLRIGKIELSDKAINFFFSNMSTLKKLIAQSDENKEIDDVTAAIKEIESFRESAVSDYNVGREELDRILDTVSELALAKDAVVRIGDELAETGDYISLTLDVRKISQTTNRKLAELRNQLLEIRMITVSQIFAPLVQVVKRYIKEVNKEIDVELSGEETKIDKQLAEGIIDPLIHIIRNVVDHDIETKDERVALGKKERGTLTIKAFSEGNKVIITVQYDGAGLSTKTGASEVSGMKSDMDIVKEKITSLGSFIDIESERGQGTTFLLTLPMSLAIIKALIVWVASEKFAVPLTSIVETFFVETEKIQTIDGREVVAKNGEMLPLLRISDVFKLGQESRKGYFAVVVGSASRRLGLLVDDLVEHTEVIVRPLGESLKNVRGFAGAAEIGRHEIILVLDVESMMKEIFSKGKMDRYV